MVSCAHRKWLAVEKLVRVAKEQAEDAAMALQDVERDRDKAHYEYWKARKKHWHI